jgi:CRP-like cAMP-binding protein
MGLIFRGTKADDKALGDQHFGRGQWLQALDAYRRVCEKDPDNVLVLRRVGDVLARLGRMGEAIEAYRRVAGLYADGGFLVQAIAIYKILLRIDPGAEDVSRKLSGLYAKRGMGVGAREEGRRPRVETPLFSELDSEAFAELLERLVSRTLGMGEALFRRGDPGDSIFVVVSGAVRVSREGMILAELSEGAFFGEGAFFSREARNADVTALAPTELLEIRREDTEALMDRYPGVATALAGFYRRRVLDGVLAASPLFGVLPEADRKRLADALQLVHVAPGDVIVREGDRDRSLYVVKRGCFVVTASVPGGREPAALDELGPGSLFGEVSLLGDTPRTATVTARGEGELLRASYEDLAPLLEARPEIREALERLRTERAADTIAKVLGRK